MATCFITLYAGMLFSNRYLATNWLLILAEVIVMFVNVSFIIYAISELMLEYAINVSQSKRFIHFVLKFHKFFTKCFKYSPKSLQKIDALHAKLERELHKEIDELMYIKKFESKLKKHVLMKHGSTKVTPSPKDKAKEAWDVNSKNEQINISKKRIDTAWDVNSKNEQINISKK